MADDWGVFVDSTKTRARPEETPEAVGDGWGKWVEPGDTASRVQSPSDPSRARQSARPRQQASATPEATASLLREGETLWAYVELGRHAVLGSGCDVRTTADPADGFTGWRPVTVIDPQALLVSIVPLPHAEPLAPITSPVSELYQGPPTWVQPEPDRAGPFPIGQGPDLPALLREVVEETERGVRARLAQIEADARQRSEATEQQARQRIESAELQARQREQQAEARAVETERRAAAEAEQAVQEANERIAAERAQATQIATQWQQEAQRLGGELTRQRSEYEAALQALRESRRNWLFLAVVVAAAVTWLLFHSA